MTPEETSIFAHHDKINNAKAGDLLLVAEPCEASLLAVGGKINLVPGQHLRVLTIAAGVLAEVAMDGRVQKVTLATEQYHCVDLAPSATKKSQKAA